MPLATPGAPTARHPESSTSGDGQSGRAPVLPEPALPAPGEVPPADPETADRHHITRIDIEPCDEHTGRHPTHGWQVRARRDGTRVSKFFADARHGSPEHALGAALVYRDRLLASLPEPSGLPRKAWSNTGVVGLSVRAKPGARARLNVQLNWIDASGRRRAASYSVDKWGLRRALWNGCLRLYRERAAAGAPVEEPHVMFARAQEPFQEQILAELAEERARAAEAPTEAPTGALRAEAPAEAPRAEAPSAEQRLASDEDIVRRLEDVLFG